MPCKLTPVPNTTDFNAPTGAKVTIETKNHLGQVMVAKAEYAGKVLTPANQAVSKFTLDVVKDRNTLKVVFAFVPTTGARGELRETDGGDSQFLRDVSSAEEFQMMRIIGV